MENCIFCGAPLDDDALFCTNCGKKVGISYRNFFVRDTSAYFPALLFSRISPKKLRNVLAMKRSRRQTKEMSAHA